MSAVTRFLQNAGYTTKNFFSQVLRTFCNVKVVEKIWSRRISQLTVTFPAVYQILPNYCNANVVIVTWLYKETYFRELLIVFVLYKILHKRLARHTEFWIGRGREYRREESAGKQTDEDEEIHWLKFVECIILKWIPIIWNMFLRWQCAVTGQIHTCS